MYRFNALLLAALLALCLSGCSATPGKVSQTKPVATLNAEEGVALQGYDAVAYFLDGKPTRGSEAFSFKWQDATWRFASAEHQAMFAANPQKYAPQFGGYCAFAVSRGMIANIDPEHWAVVDDKLYLNNNGFAHGLWQRDQQESIAAGHLNWPLIPKKHSEKSTQP
jgi:hypothetical protein